MTTRRYPLMPEFLALHAGHPGCWIYPSSRTSAGYAFYGIGQGRRGCAHRVAWETVHGVIPAGLFVCHSCDNPPCCRPSHLFIGTAGDNHADSVQKDRHVRGERHGSSRLTNQQVLSIRLDARLQRAIAQDYGICQQAVSLIKRGKRWAPREEG